MRIMMIIAGILGTLLLLIVLAAFVLLGGGSMIASLFPTEKFATADMPWAAPGQRARLYGVKRWDWNNGSVGELHWGSGRFSKQAPVDIVFQAFAFLEKHRAMNDWPPSMPDSGAGIFTTYSVYDEPPPGTAQEKDGYGNNIVTYTKRIAPYRFFLVSIEPTVILMRPTPELAGWWQDYARSEFSGDSQWMRWVQGLPEEQKQWTIWLDNQIEYGTRLPAGEGWQWFSPQMGQLPTPLALSAGQAVSIPLPKGTLAFSPDGDGWRVARE